MPRPTTKSDLLAFGEANYSLFESLPMAAKLLKMVNR